MQSCICGTCWINRSDPLNLQDFEDLLLILTPDIIAHPQGSSAGHALMGQGPFVSKEEDQHNQGLFPQALVGLCAPQMFIASSQWGGWSYLDV